LLPNSRTMTASENVGEQPSLMLHSPVALILDKQIPRLNYLVTPPLQYGYMLLVVMRSDWAALGEADRILLREYFTNQLEELEEAAEKAATRAWRVLRRGGMKELRLPESEVERLRINLRNGLINAPLQSQFADVLDGMRRASSDSD
jgi:hypothetical protein